MTESQRIDVKEAVRLAKEYVRDFFGSEGISNLGLEEIEYDDGHGQWLITVGFSRPWNSIKSATALISGEPQVKRAYRVVKLDGQGGMISVKRRIEDE
jgi:hypothetical protein